MGKNQQKYTGVDFVVVIEYQFAYQECMFESMRSVFCWNPSFIQLCFWHCMFYLVGEVYPVKMHVLPSP